MELWLDAIRWKRTKEAVAAFRGGLDAPEAAHASTGGSSRSQGAGVGTRTRSGEESIHGITGRERDPRGAFDFEKAFIDAQKDKWQARL